MTPPEAARAGVPVLVSKLGEMGTRVWTGEESVFLPPYSVDVVSTIGAGDGFASGFLYALIQKRPLLECLHYGNAAAAIVVSRLSCSEAMPTLAEVEAMIARAGQPHQRDKRIDMFSAQQFLPDAVLAALTEIRVQDPEFSWRSARAAHPPRPSRPAGKLNILAADHPARRVTRSATIAWRWPTATIPGAHPARLWPAPRGRRHGDHGHSGRSADRGRPAPRSRGRPLLDGKLAIASLNRGGLAGSAWELDDPVTGPSAAACRSWSWTASSCCCGSTIRSRHR